MKDGDMDSNDLAKQSNEKLLAEMIEASIRQRNRDLNVEDDTHANNVQTIQMRHVYRMDAAYNRYCESLTILLCDGEHTPYDE